MNVTLDHIEDTAANIKTFYFKPERPVHYTAGQFTELYLHHSNPDDRGEKRFFTVSSSPTEPFMTITTKFAADRSSTFKQALRTLTPGTPLKLADPMGDFVLPKDKSIPLLFVAGGIGVTPMHSMIKYLQDTGEQRDIQLMYAVNTDKELAFVPLFKEYGLKFTPIVKEPSPGYNGETGTLTVERLLEAIGGSQDMLIYLSGPEPMTKAFAEGLKQHGIHKHRIITDYFPGYTKF